MPKTQTRPDTKIMVRVAVVGCSHGMLDEIYATIEHINEVESTPVELLLCCGDFQCVRNTRDLSSLACPPKYRQMHTFHEYYSGTKKAPVLTIFVGGNHEASNYLRELHYGGWVAPNIFYLGAAGVIKVAGLQIAGLSGIFKPEHYRSGHFEEPPYNNSTLRSVYHVREVDVFKLSHVAKSSHRIDAFLSHDWPRGIEQYGDVAGLLRKKSYFQEEIQQNALGSPAAELLLHQLQPRFWFAAHLHVKFPAIVRHEMPPSAQESIKEETPMAVTKFLALDKCLPRRDFLQVLDVPTEDETTDLKVRLDYEWLAILRATHHLESTEVSAPEVPTEELEIEESDVAWVKKRVSEFYKAKGLEKEEGEWMCDFVKTVPGWKEQDQANVSFAVGNPQTDLLLELLQLPHVVTKAYQDESEKEAKAAEDPNAIDLDELEEQETEQVPEDPNEMDIDE